MTMMQTILGLAAHLLKDRHEEISSETTPLLKLTETVILLKLTWSTVHLKGCSDLPSFSHEHVLHLGGIHHSDPLELCKHWEHRDNTHLGGHQQVSQENCKEYVPLFLLTAIKKHNAPEHMQQYDNERHESWKDKSAINSQSCRQQTLKPAEPHHCAPALRVPWLQGWSLTTSAQNWLNKNSMLTLYLLHIFVEFILGNMNLLNKKSTWVWLSRSFPEVCSDICMKSMQVFV